MARFFVVLIAANCLFVTALAFGCCPGFFVEGPVGEFFRSLYLGVLLAIAGIPIGLQINQLWKKMTDDKRKRELLRATRESLVTNIGYIDEAVRLLEAEVINAPTFSFDTAMLEHTAGIRYELIDDFDLLRKIDRAAFSLNHLTAKIERLLDFVPTIWRSTSNKREIRYRVNALDMAEEMSKTPSLQALAESIRKWCEKSKALTKYEVIAVKMKSKTIKRAVGKEGTTGTRRECESAIEAIDKVLQNASR